MFNSAPTDIFAENPYEGHPSLSPQESEVLWEYAKLAQHVKQVRTEFGSPCAGIDSRPARPVERASAKIG